MWFACFARIGAGAARDQAGEAVAEPLERARSVTIEAMMSTIRGQGFVAVALATVCACSSQRNDDRRAFAGAPQRAIEAVQSSFATDARATALATARESAFARVPSSAADDAATRERIVSEGWRSTREQRFGDLGARLPDSAEGAMEVGVSRFEALQLRITLDGAANSPARLTQGRVVYPAVFNATDRVLTSDAAMLEEFLVLHDASAPRAFKWSIERAAGLTHVSERAEGFVFADDAGTPKLTLARPVARDARGAVVALDVSWDAGASALTVRLRDQALAAYPLVIDPRYETSSWVELKSRRPLYRLGVSLAYDAARDEMVMFGGQNGTFADDTWIWNGGTHAWTQRSPVTRPPGRSDHAVAYDSARREVIVFGGITNAGVRLADTWSWNGTTWTNRTPTTGSPAARNNHTLAYDSARGEIVLFGGASSDAATSALADTWIWSGAASTWTQRTPSSAPTARYAHAAAYDAARSEVVLFGGYGTNTSTLNDTWVWSGSAGAWTRRVTASPPSARAAAALTFDNTRNEVLMLGGRPAGVGSTTLSELWSWNGAASAWTLRGGALSGRADHGFAYDSVRRELVSYGGDGAGGIPSQETWVSPSGTSNWSVVSPGPSPPSLVNHALAFDSARGEIILFGGSAQVISNNATWVWNGARGLWTQLSPSTSPSSRSGHKLAYDANRAEIVLFGGASASATYLNDTWTWNGAAQTWSLRATGLAPSPRASFGFTYDSVRGEALLFGGIVTGGTESAETWTWHGETSTWTRRTPASSPTARANGGLVFDTSRGEVVLFAGRGNSVAYADIWTWSGSTWSERAPATPPPPARSGLAMTFDASRREVLIHGGIGEQTGLGDTWTWNGATNEWSQRFPASAPSPRSYHAMAFDTVRKEAMLFGDGGPLSAGDTWLHRTLGGGCTTNDECVGADAFCTDGVCCNSAACRTCATCNGASPGRCTDVLNREDADTCAAADGKSCSDVGDCRAALGRPATDASACASGFVVDGVCCDTPSCGPCETCDVAKKERNEFVGRCSAAKAGTDPHDDCADEGAPTCGKNGQCDGNRSCTLYARGVVCAAGRYCSGAGQCTAEGGSCDGDHAVVAPDGTKSDCGSYKCEGSTCKTACMSKADCVGDADCTASHECVRGADLGGSGGGGCAATRVAAAPRSETSGAGLPLTALVALAALVVRRRRGGRR